MPSPKASHRLKKLCLSMRGAGALERLEREGPPGAEETLSILAPRNATMALFSGAFRASARAEDGAGLASVFCRLLAGLPEAEKKSPGLAKRLSQARACGFWARCLLARSGALYWASERGLSEAMQGLLAVAPQALRSRALGPEDLRDTSVGLESAPRGEPAWEKGEAADADLARFWAPIAASSATPRQEAELINRAIAGGRCHNALAYLKAKGEPCGGSWTQSALMKWASHPPRAGHESGADRRGQSSWMELGERLAAGASKEAGEQALEIALGQMGSRGTIGFKREALDERVDLALRVAARAGWDFPSQERWPTGSRTMFGNIGGLKGAGQWERARARYDQFALERELEAGAKAPSRPKKSM